MDDLAEIKLENYRAISDKRAWLIVETGEGYQVHQWEQQGVWPTFTYPTKRAAASRVLQLLGIGPVSPQMHPERVCIDTVETEKLNG